MIYSLFSILDIDQFTQPALEIANAVHNPSEPR